MKLNRQRRFVRIQSFDLYVSSIKNCTRFTIDSNIGRFSGIAEDPVDFIAEMAAITGKYRFGEKSFNHTAVTITTDAAIVNREYLTEMEQEKNWSYGQLDEICIYSGSYKAMRSDMNIHLPVGQHCFSLFNLYLNALRYLYTMSRVPAEKS